MTPNHEHEHEHAHAHHHTHSETIDLEWADIQFEAHTHEQAATVSMAIHPKAGCTATFSSLVDIMQNIARAAEASGGVVGHIKAFSKQGDAFAHASVTAADLAPTCEGDQSRALEGDADIQLVAIVLLLSEKDLLAICKDALG